MRPGLDCIYDRAFFKDPLMSVGKERLVRTIRYQERQLEKLRRENETLRKENDELKDKSSEPPGAFDRSVLERSIANNHVRLNRTLDAHSTMTSGVETLLRRKRNPLEELQKIYPLQRQRAMNRTAPPKPLMLTA
jgi:predicted RNase H-like nuclease (RuvC/YqgF family)